MEAGYFARLRRSWFPDRANTLWLLLGLLPLMFFQTTIHEGSHCVMLTATGQGCRVMAPFPVVVEPGFAVHGATFAVDESREPLQMVIAPQVVAAVMIVVLRLVPRTRDERWLLLRRLCLFGACVDLANNTLWFGFGFGGDWAILARALEPNTAATFGLTIPLWALVAWGVFTPLPDPAHVSRARVRDFWEIGLLYAAVSATAAIVASTVHVPDQIPTHWWHWVPILLQIANAVVCVAVVAGSRRSMREPA